MRPVHVAAPAQADAVPGRAPTFGHLAEGRNNNFDFLRFILAALVLYSHSFPLVSGPFAPDTVYKITRHQIDGGNLAVNFFFLISGFLVTASWLNSRGPFDYLKRRILRIYPGFLVAAAFAAFVVGPLGAAAASAYFHDLRIVSFVARAIQLRTLQLPTTFADNAYGNTVNGSLWTIRPEFELYLIVAALGLAGAYRRRTVALILAGGTFIVWAVTTYHVGALHDHAVNALGSHIAWTTFFLYFLAGMTFYLYRGRIPHSHLLFAGSIAVIVVTAATDGLALALPMFGAYAFMYIAFSTKIRLYGFARNRDLSYGVYLYAWPVQQLVVLYLGARLNAYTLFLIALPLTCGMAAISWYAVERPFLRLKRSRRATREQPSPAGNVQQAGPVGVPVATPLAVFNVIGTVRRLVRPSTRYVG